VSSPDHDAALEGAFDRRQPRDSTTASSDDDESSRAAVVALEDVVILDEPSAVQATGVEAAAAMEGAGLATNSLYELD
jgi:hypothetical protein